MMNSTNTHWQWYKDFFKVTVFRYLITWFAIVPFFVKALDSIPKKVMFQTAPNVQIPINIEMPFHWQLLWLSSLAFVLSFALYKIFCPGFITKYPNYSKYLKYNHSPRWIVWESSKLISKNFEKSKFLERLMEKDYLVKSESSVTNPDKSPIIGTFQTVLYLNHNNETYELGMPILHSSPAESEQVTMVAEKEIFWEILKECLINDHSKIS